MVIGSWRLLKVRRALSAGQSGANSFRGESNQMLLGATLAGVGGVVALVAVIALMIILGDPMAEPPTSPPSSLSRRP
jgi:hypothetical protein